MTALRVSLDEIDFSDAPFYRKTSTVRARKAVAGERLSTTLSNGLVETDRTLDGTEWVVTNPGGEEYAPGGDTFTKNYAPTEEEGVYRAIGVIQALANPWSCDIAILAPWGEDQFGDARCLIALSSSGSRYLIGADEFAQTYGE